MDRRLDLISEMSLATWVHLVAVLIAVILGAVVLFGRKGTARHKLLGRIWVGLMVIGAVSSFWIMEIFEGSFSPIHLLSVYTLFSVFMGVRAIRKQPRDAKALRRHGYYMQSLYATGLLIAGGFTFLPYRLLGRLSFGEWLPALNFAIIAILVGLGLWLWYRSARPQA